MTKRIEFIDAAKGIGILLVVLGHNELKNIYPILFQLIYSFHMPLFFMLSGMFFNVKYGFLELVKRRFKSLLLPFMTTILLLYLASGFFTNMAWDTIFRRVGKALYAGSKTLDWAPLWFLPHLFLVALFAYPLVKVIYGRLPALWMRLLALLALLGAGVFFLKVFWPLNVTLLGSTFSLKGLPWSADLLLVTTAFFLLGYEVFRTIPQALFSRWWLLLGSMLIFFGLNLFFSYRLDFYDRRYDSFIVVTLEALSGSLMVLCLSKWLEMRGGLLLAVFKYLGNASIILLLFHLPVQDYTLQKLTGMGLNDVLGASLSFAAGVLVPLAMYTWLIRPNPWVARWFGLSSKPSE